MPPLSAYESHFRLAFPLLCRLSPLCRLTKVALGWLSLCSVGLSWPLSVEVRVGVYRRCPLGRLTKIALGWPSLYSVGLPWPLSVEGGGVS